MTTPFYIRHIVQLRYLIGFILFFIYSINCNSQFSEFRFTNLSTADGLSQNTVTCITQDKYGFIWIGTFNGINRFDGYEFKTYMHNKTDTTGLSMSRCQNIYTDTNGNLWLQTVDNITHLYNYEQDKFLRIKDEDIPQVVIEKYSERIEPRYFTYKNHKFRFHYNVNHLFEYTNTKKNTTTSDVIDLDNPFGIHDNYLIEMYLDKYHNIWIGSFSKGVYYASLEQQKFNHLIPNHKKSTGNNIRAIYLDKNNILWLGTRDQGLIKYNRNTEKLIKQYVKNNSKINTIVNNDIRNIFKDYEGCFWIGTKGGVDRFDPETESFEHILQGSGYDFTKYVFDIAQDDEKNIWIATFDGLLKYNHQTKKPIKLTEKDGIIIHPSVRFIHPVRNKKYWIGSEVGGLSLLTKIESSTSQKDTFSSVQFTSIANNPKSLSNNRVYSFCEDNDGTMWFGTAKGLNKFNESDQSFDKITIDNGLSNDMILGILTDNNNCLWISHKQGISKLNKKTLEITNYTINDGLQGTEFNEDAYYKSPETGEMFFGGPNGINSFFPDSIIEKNPPPKVYITKLMINGNECGINDTINKQIILKKNLILTNDITLSAKEKVFALEFAAINYINPQGHVYKYMMKGFDDKWYYTNNKMRRASYTNLSPGDYTFIVDSRSGTGDWSNNPATLNIHILPPYWQTWWFRITISFFAVALILLIYYLRSRNLKRKNIMLEQIITQRTKELRNSNDKIKTQFDLILNKNEEISAQSEQLEEQKNKIEKAYDELDTYKNKLEELVELRTIELVKAKEKAEESDKLKTSFLSNLSHEIRTPLNAIVGFSNFLSEVNIKKKDRIRYNSIISSNCNSLLDLIDEIVDYSKIESSSLSLNISDVPINEILDELKQVYEIELTRQQYSVAYNNKKINFVIEYPVLDNQPSIKTDYKRIIQILSYLINNAIKFTNEGTIKAGCRIDAGKKHIHFYVKDSGIGISHKDQEIIFQRFRKIESTGSHLFRGIGLGLSIALQLAQKLGGELDVESKEGFGATFSVILPYSISSNVEHSNDQTIFDKGKCRNKIILIAEDDPSNYIYLKRLVLLNGAKDIHAKNGAEVLDILAANDQIDLILMDIRMPVMDGYTALKKIREMGINIPVIAQTAFAFNDEIEKIKNTGFDDILTKPISITSLNKIFSKYF